MADPLSVRCPDCMAPEGTACGGSLERTHAERRRLADLRALEHGTCALCGQPMVRGSVEGSPIDAWHYQPEDAAACPKMPDPLTDWNRYATMVNLGLSAGHPGVEHFLAPVLPLDPEPEPAAPMPESSHDPRGYDRHPGPQTGPALVGSGPGTWSRSDFTGGVEEVRGEGRHCEDPYIVETHPPHGWSPAGDPTRWRYWCSGTPEPACGEAGHA